MSIFSSKEIKAILKTADKPDVAETINEAAEKKIRIETSNPYVKITDQTFANMQLKYEKEVERALKEAEEKAEEEARKKQAQEEWIWITGYKGTRKDMTCRNTQYEMGKQFSMPKDTVIKDCSRGYHLCKELKDVYNYYPIGDGNRYFEVQALVRKSDFEEYGVKPATVQTGYWHYTPYGNRDKLAAKSIVFTRELDADEIFNAESAYRISVAGWTPEQKQEALATSIVNVQNKINSARLVELGYSEGFATYITENGRYQDAVLVASQKDLSMDMKVVAILRM